MPEEIERNIEDDHGHCADVLMSDYGISYELRREVCEEVSKVWVWDTMFHDLVVAAVRGYYRSSTSVEPLKKYLESKQTHPPRNHNPEPLSLEDSIRIW